MIQSLDRNKIVGAGEAKGIVNYTEPITKTLGTFNYVCIRNDCNE